MKEKRKGQGIVDGAGTTLVRTSTALLVLSHIGQQVLVPVQRKNKSKTGESLFPLFACLDYTFTRAVGP